MRVAGRVEDIVERGLCTGCGACASLLGNDALGMDLSPDGFMRPRRRRRLKDTEQVTVMQVCTGNRLSGPAPEDAAAPHPIFGPILHLARGHATDPEIRFRSATGGVLTALALYLVESGEVDGILQVGVSSDNPLLNDVSFNTSREQIVASSGSRYGPTAPLRDIMAMLDSGRRFAFIGKPCDIATLRNLARVDARVDRQIPYMLAMFCGGNPSISATYNIVRRFGEDHRDVDEFRYRGHGWPGPTYVRTRQGKEHRQSYDETWFSNLTYELMFRCKICADGTGEHADVVAGDCWVMENGKPSHREAGDGWNMHIARTVRGTQLIEDAVVAGYLHEEPFSVAELEAMHDDHGLKKRSVFWRLTALALTAQPFPDHGALRVVQAGLAASWRERWAAFRGTLARSLKRRNRESPVTSGTFAPDTTTS
ncbi:Coenzyme F420 hydrogenase/dehydrogenase, beta subunit C-terminal domain [Aminobacter carboxidus]|uniref:Coenzyme F420 hydrogenase/dehydrogenase, beta subunit C-terminal domain n=1 Tax=Aminobacter carboxidus TaxID=376165 RepID=A0ABR9GGW4_9HYPH|nr:Coenzyme F420 hydrogenase/dehydrogenase, beta subunit C-terminal domain [Aminobacter carboxidus]MBE1202867.1 Coenzyme F420 hydrogenase/dehydrogenase, beta subunit C-terminal domain [Aminobacter carboxidus]